MKRISLIWPDGSIVSGTTYAEVEEALRATQWTTYSSRRAFRREMRRRAAIWSGRGVAKPIAWQTSKGFIWTLVNSGMCMIEETEQEQDPQDPTTTDVR